MKAELSFLHEEIAGEAKISAEVLFIPLAKIYCAFHRIHPHEVANFVHMGNLPAADIVVTTNALDKLFWSGRELLREELLIALPASHPLADRSSISEQEKRKMLFFLLRHGDPIYEPDSLTPLGQYRAEALGRRLAVYGLDKIFFFNIAARFASVEIRVSGEEWNLYPSFKETKLKKRRCA